MRPRLPFLFTACCLVVLGSASSQELEPILDDIHEATTSYRAKFLTVELDEETREADEALVDKLNNTVPMVHFALETYSYETVVEMLAEWNFRDPLVARLTPYVYLAAESLGANLVPLATYRSAATGTTTYYSWFVVRTEDLKSTTPTPQDVIEFIRSGRNDLPEDGESPEERRIRFGYHSRFSTSSYFVPALFFLENEVFHMPKSTGEMLAIKSLQISENSSSKLVEQVARGGEDGLDLAAVWDGKVLAFCGEEPKEVRSVGEGKQKPTLFRRCRVQIEEPDQERDFEQELYFIRLPIELPNDLLVCSASVSEDTRRSITRDIKLMDDIGIGDFVRWEEIRQAGRARAALAELLRKARRTPATLTIDVRADASSNPPVLVWQEMAVKEAIELTGTEFTVWEREYHRRRDFEWTLRLTHDGALELTSVPLGFPNAQEAKQVHTMSFQNKVDLIDRTTNFIVSRMHRVRHIWPYWSRPTVIRDLPFALPEEGVSLKIAKIEWQDLDHNAYLLDTKDALEGVVEASDFHKLHLAVDDGGIDFDPMSNVWYRVLLTREERESDVLRALTWVFVGLLILAAVASVVDLRLPVRKALERRRNRQGEPQAEEAHAD